MDTSKINWGDETIDSREINARHEELTSELSSLRSIVDDFIIEINDLQDQSISTEDLYTLDKLNESLEKAEEDLNDFIAEYGNEIDELDDVREQCENYPDWNDGEVLINDNYFEDYIKDQINDCYDFPDELKSGEWPWNHMVMDWEGAAEDAKQDYNEIEIAGNNFHIRS